jgi:hypothetical protein
MPSLKSDTTIAIKAGGKLTIEQLRQRLTELRRREKELSRAIVEAEIALILREWTRKVNGL